jgi:hypothetical protein
MLIILRAILYRLEKSLEVVEDTAWGRDPDISKSILSPDDHR